MTLKSHKKIHHKKPIGPVPIGLMVLTIETCVLDG